MKAREGPQLSESLALQIRITSSFIAKVAVAAVLVGVGDWLF
jgi:hypothetical protein